MNIKQTSPYRFARKIYRFLIKFKKKKEFDYINLWERNYNEGKDSGSGSYGILAEFKSEIINNFVKQHELKNVIEFGCGDGNQLKYMNYKNYLGLDVSKSAIKLCSSIFRDDHAKSFFLYDPKFFYNNGFLKSELVICLDVLYHIIPEVDFKKTLQDIFSCSSKFIILYTDTESYKNFYYQPDTHIYHRNIFDYLSIFTEFRIIELIEQRYKKLSSANFLILEKL